MSATGLVCRGLPTPTSLVFMVIVVVVLGCRCVSGRPQSHQDSREARTQSALRFSPELLLEPSLESAASPASVLPRRPSASSPSTHHHLASPYAQTKENNHKGVPGDDWQRFSEDLDGPEEKWEHDPDMEDSDIPPTQRWSERTSDLHGDKVVVPPVVMDDLNVDRLHGALTGFNKEDGNEDLDVPELRLKDRDSDRFRTAGSGYVRAPHKVVDQGVPSPELLARDVDVDGPPLPSAHIPMPDDVPADPRQIVPWQAVLEKDVDVDRPIRYHSSPLPASLTGEDASRQQWKKLALKDLAVDKDMAALARQDVRTDVDVDVEINPFEVDEEENEVPEELIRRVVHAMDAPPAWRASSVPQGGEVEDIWAEGSGDSDENADQYIDWVIQEQAVPRSSRLIAMIFEIIDDPEEMLDDEEEEGEEEEEEEHSAAAYEKELSIWQILTNFPFPMLVSQGDETAIQVDYIYDDDDDDGYDDEYDEDDYYDDDEYEDDEDYDDDDEEEDSDDEDEDEGEKDDDLDDYFYSEEYDECRDCTENDGTAKQEITVLSLAPMLTR